jgi:predicted ATPase/class 3 adenylate cyclase
MSDREEQAKKLTAAIAGLEAQRGALGDAVVDPALAALREQLSQLDVAVPSGAADDERKIVTVLFADVTGFTALAEKLDPEEVRALINDCFECLVPVVQKYGGTIDKFIGDEIMALFGAPLAHEDDPERALRTALEMMEAISGFNCAHETKLGLHLGVNTGPVIAGKIGTESRREYSVMGDSVNLAARLEDASSSGEIFVGPNTYRRTAALFDFEKLPPLSLKGKEKVVQCYRLIGLKTTPRSARGIEGLRAPLIGRDREINQIRSALAKLQIARGTILAIVGEAGFGKSRLLAEGHACLNGNAIWAEGRALSYTAGMSYWLAREILLSLLGIKSDAPASAVEQALRKHLEQEFPHGVSEVYPYLARALELPMEPAMEERVKFLSGDTLRARILQAFHDFVRAHATKQPLVLVWEDLHWCDSSSLQVLDRIMPLTEDVPLLLLCAARPDEKRVVEFLARARETHRANYCGIELSPLSRQQSGSLIEQLLRIEKLPETMRDLILDRAEGNPFYLEELLRSLLDSGVLILQKDGAIATRELRSIDIPDTLQGVLAARIDRLEREHKHTLQNASVIGRIFQERVLIHLYETGSAKERLAQSLAELQRREFIQSREQYGSETAALQEDEYIFKHAITHEVAYDSMLLARRKELHKLTAQTIEKLFPDRLDDLAATLGYHYERADAAAKAVHYLGRAGARAQATFANTEALAFYRSAIAQIERIDLTKEDAPIRTSAARLNEGLADVMTLMGQHAEARAAYDCARSFVPKADSIWRSRLYRKTGFSHNLQRHYEETGRAYDSAEKELGDMTSTRSPDWWEEKVQIQLERMQLLYWQGMAGEMKELAERYRSAIEQRGTPIQRGRFFEKLALSDLTGSRYHPTEECVKLAELAFSESQGSSNLSEISHIRFVLGLVNLWCGNYASAVEHGEAALQLAQRCGDLVTQARSLTYLAVAHRCAHHLEQARRFAAQTLELATKIGMVEYVAMAKANLAWVAWREDNHAEAEKLGSEALRLWHGMEDPYSLDWMALWPLIAVAFGRNDIAQAIDYARGMLVEQQRPLPEKLAAATQKAIESWEANQLQIARADLERAIQTATEFGQL